MEDNGERIPAPTTFATKHDAELWLAEQQVRRGRGTWPDPRRGSITLSEFGTSWLSTKQYTPKSRESAERLWRLHIEPELGPISLTKITQPIVLRWYSDLVKRTGPGSLRNSHNILKAMLNAAVDQDLIVKNPVRIKGANRPVGNKRPLMEFDHVEQIASCIASHLVPLVLTAWWSSGRVGELIALRWEDVDFETDEHGAGRLHVHRQLVYASGKLHETAPKSHSDRFVPIPEPGLEVLRDLKLSVGPLLLSARVFTNMSGGTLTPHAVNQAWIRARTKAGLHQFRFHDIRHGSATFAAQSGATLYEVMERLGHQSMNAALVYQHASTSRGSVVAANMAANVVAKKAARAMGTNRAHRIAE